MTCRKCSTIWAAVKKINSIQATPSANVKNMWSTLTRNYFLPLFCAFFMARSSNSQDQEMRKLEETLPVQRYIICVVYVLKCINVPEMRN